MGRFAKIYGAGPLHLLSGVASLVVAAYAVVKIRELGAAGNVAIWFVGLIIVHDLLLLPLSRSSRRSPSASPGSMRCVPCPMPRRRRESC